ncbi:DNA-directed RNA polymerase III subunit RPC6-like [Diaphorina citri]|uniref:DNA-directed RNA polymerase III subunit RPC6-like n=1 Tax=Diaphorina citri TaxID=121845 RepID=A0A3Q0J3C4_DIACI|nr:DNA-directed RNA polymerase III subunit RPC6-like [Diaphorina citri]
MASTTDAELQSVLALIQAAGSAGITDELIQEKMPDLPLEKRLQIFNKLIAQGLLDLFNQGGNLLYKVKDPVTNEKLKDSDNEEKVVYKIIEEAGNKGIWMRDIRFKSNLMPTQLNKILKQLETKKIIKAVKSVAVSQLKLIKQGGLAAQGRTYGCMADAV